MTKKDRINLGLELLSLRARRGVPFSTDEIAAWCGCTGEAVRFIERKALAKVRRMLKKKNVTGEC